MTREELMGLVGSEHQATVQKWLDRGDGVAVYRNAALDSSSAGNRVFVSFGSPAAQVEDAEPPQTMPDIGPMIGWKYQLEAVVR